MTVGDAAAVVREALRRTPSLNQRVVAMDALDLIEGEVERLQQLAEERRELAEALLLSNAEQRDKRDVARAEAGKLRAAHEEILLDGAPGDPLTPIQVRAISRAALAGSEAPPVERDRCVRGCKLDAISSRACEVCGQKCLAYDEDPNALSAAAVPAERET